MKVRIDFKFVNLDTNEFYLGNTITLLDIKNKKKLLKEAKQILFDDYGIKVVVPKSIYVDETPFKPRKVGFYRQFKERYENNGKLFKAEVRVTFEELKPIYF